MRQKSWGLRLLAFLLTFSLTPVGLAGFSPALDRMQAAYEQGQAMALEVRAALYSWSALSPDSLAAVQEALNAAELKLQAQKSSGQSASAMTLTHEGLELYRINESQDALRRLTQLMPQGTRYTSIPAQDPLGLLTGAGPAIPWESLLHVGFLPSLQDALQKVYALIAPFQKSVQVSTSIKNVGTSRTRLEYALTREEWTAMRPSIEMLLRGALEPWLGQAPSQAIAALRFEDDGVFKRFMDEDGMDLGWQFTGRLSFGQDDTRRVTLFGGFRQDKGLYLSLKAPAVKGRNDLAFNLSARQSAKGSKRSLQADYTFTSRLADVRLSAKGLIKLESADAPDGERISGSIRLDSTQTPGQTARLRITLKPELLLSDSRISGTLTLARELGSAADLALKLHLLLKPAEAVLPPDEKGAIDLSALTPGELRQEQDIFLLALLDPLKGFLLQLPQNQRMQMLHDMGRVLRTSGDSVPPLPEAAAGPYIVSDISVEEENP